MYLETAASGPAQNGTPGTTGFGDLLQGNLEQANVEAVTEISDLIAAQYPSAGGIFELQNDHGFAMKEPPLSILACPLKGLVGTGSRG